MDATEDEAVLMMAGLDSSARVRLQAKTSKALGDFMEKRRVGKGAEFTHTQLGRSAGAFYVPHDDMSDFYSLYCDAMSSGADLHVTERHRHISPVCIDVDLRLPLCAGKDRKYAERHVESIVREYAKALSVFHGVEAIDGKEFFVMEKPAPRLKADVIKDGFHIMAPMIVTRASVQHLARTKVMHELSVSDALLDIGATNSIDDIIDQAVISRNNWFVYGSKKPEHEETAYLVTKVITVHQETDGNNGWNLSIRIPFEETPVLVQQLSLRNKYDEVPVLSEMTAAVLEFESAEVSKARRLISDQTMLDHTATLKVEYDGDDLMKVRAMASLLSTERLGTYDGWMRVGWCLKNIDDSLLDTWIEISQKSTKYTNGECERLWTRMRRGTLGVGTLYMWARADDPLGFAELKSTSIHELIVSCVSGTHNDVAKVVFGLFEHRFVCSGVRTHAWYEFSGHRWKTSDSGYSLRKKLSIDVWREFMKASTKLTSLALATNNMVDQQQKSEQSKKILEVANKLKITLFKDHVMKECAELFYQEKFEEKLDSNINLIGFENGVYDLDADEFRDGRPDDYVTFTTGNNYVEYNENSIATDGVHKYMAQVLTNPAMREYVLKLFASFLHGATKEQKFYVWTGSGSNSKSKLVELFELCFGDYCCKLPVTLLTQKRAASNAATSEVAKSKGKRFACMQEPSEDEKMNVGLMKELSGGDKIMARCIYKEPIEFKPQFKMILLCNHLPDVPSDDGGTWRRIRVVEFTSKFVDKPNPNSLENEFPIDLDLTTKMETWKEAFMALLIRYYKRYKIEGIPEPDDVLRCTNEYKRQNDQLAEFVEHFIDKDGVSFLSLSEAYSEAKAYAKDANIVKFVGRKVFDKYMERALNTKTILVNGIKGLRGFKYKPPQRPMDDVDDLAIGNLVIQE